MKESKLEIAVLLGREVRTRRMKLGISQEELAWRASLNRTYVTDIERGARNLSLATIEKLAEALEAPVFELLRKVEAARGAREGSQAVPVQVDILFVEDNPRDVELTLQAMRRARLSNTFHVVRDGSEAMEYLFGKEPFENRPLHELPHLILLDLDLPGMDGMELLRRIKSDSRTCSIPVVVLTVSDQARDFEEARQLGAEAYIVKPVDFNGLNKVVPMLNMSWSLLRPI